MTREFHAYMVVRTTVEAVDYKAAQRIARDRFEAVQTDEVELCTKLGEPHPPGPTSRGLRVSESLASRQRRERPWTISRIEGSDPDRPLCTDDPEDPEMYHRFRAVDTWFEEPETEMCRQCPAMRTRPRVES